VFKLLFVVTEDWYFCSHRLNLAVEAINAGFDVTVATRVTKHGNKILDAGIHLIPLTQMVRSGTNPINEIRCIKELVQVYKKVQPDIVHHVAMKPMLYGSIAAYFSKVKYKVQAISGFGFVFLSDTWKAKLLRFPVCRMLQMALCGKNTSVVVQNPDDARLAESLGVKKSNLHIIAGSGVDTHAFFPVQEPESDCIRVTLVARMLWDKGIGEFVEAIRLLKGNGLNIQAYLVGEPDDSNPASIPLSKLQEWQQSIGIQYEGRRSDIAKVWKESHIAVLPSYREGLPKSLLEAAACGRAMVATDVPGCRSVAIDNETGLLVQAKDAESLAFAIEKLVNNKELRLEMGENARKLIENEMSDQVINGQFIEFYHRLLMVNV